MNRTQTTDVHNPIHNIDFLHGHRKDISAGSKYIVDISLQKIFTKSVIAIFGQVLCQ